ncbi:MAG: site-specific integrase [Phaeodactylibacter sp.]|nr:site-specific integrase [Phaeodactylibacter sp.]
MVINWRGTRRTWSTGEMIPPQYWSNKTNRAKASASFPENVSINDRLRRLERIAIEFFNEVLQGLAKLEDFKSEMTKRVDWNYTHEKEAARQLIPYAEKFLEAKKGQIRIGTWRAYKTTVGVLKSFQEHTGKTLQFEDIDHNFKAEFIDFLFSVREYEQNYAGKTLSRVQMFMRAAKDEGLHGNEIPFRSRFNDVGTKTKLHPVLSFAEMEQLQRLDLSHKKSLERARDVFLVGCYTGQRWSDYSRLTISNIVEIEGIQLLDVTQVKTDERVLIPVLPQLSEILSKYDFDLPKPISNQKFNGYIKEVCRLAGIDMPFKYSTYKAKVREDIEAPKYEKITSHCARRSFATAFYLMGIPAYDLMKVTGHKTETQFLQYVQIDQQTAAVRLAKVFKASFTEGRHLRAI